MRSSSCFGCVPLTGYDMMWCSRRGILRGGSEGGRRHRRLMRLQQTQMLQALKAEVDSITRRLAGTEADNGPGQVEPQSSRRRTGGGTQGVDDGDEEAEQARGASPPPISMFVPTVSPSALSSTLQPGAYSRSLCVHDLVPGLIDRWTLGSLAMPTRHVDCLPMFLASDTQQEWWWPRVRPLRSSAGTRLPGRATTCSRQQCHQHRPRGGRGHPAPRRSWDSRPTRRGLTGRATRRRRRTRRRSWCGWRGPRRRWRNYGGRGRRCGNCCGSGTRRCRGSIRWVNGWVVWVEGGWKRGALSQALRFLRLDPQNLTTGTRGVGGLAGAGSGTGGAGAGFGHAQDRAGVVGADPTAAKGASCVNVVCLS